MPHGFGYESTILLAKAKHERNSKRLDSAIELLNQIIAFGEKDKDFTRHYGYSEAHAELYRVYKAMGDDREAFKYYKKAIQLDISHEQLDD